MVCGFGSDFVTQKNITKVINLNFENTGEAMSLECASDNLNGSCLISYGDILFRRYILDELLANPDDIVCCIDAQSPSPNHRDSKRLIDRVQCVSPYTGSYLEDDTVSIKKFLKDDEDLKNDGEFIGLMKFSSKGSTLVREELKSMQIKGTLEKANMPNVLQQLIDKGIDVKAHYITGHWLDVDDAFDLARIRNMI